MEFIILQPVVKTCIWGTEQWGISAHSNGESIVTNMPYKGKLLSSLWAEHPELFGNTEYKKFPLLTKIIDAREDLSIQVHPDDDYAFVHEQCSVGKTECWYVMQANPDSTIIIGHNAKDKEQVKDMILNKKWSAFIRQVKVQKGDFFYITPGTVHAIKGGTVLLETQQSCDITYRVYDYDRLQNGKPRPLHIDKCLDVIKAPFVDMAPPVNSNKSIGNVRQLVSCSYFTVWHGVVDGCLEVVQNQPFLLCTVIDGNCVLQNVNLVKGMSFILPYNFGKALFYGKAELIFSCV